MADFREKAPEGWQDLPDDKLVLAAIGELWEFSAFSGDLDRFRAKQIHALTPGQLAVFATYWVNAAIHTGGFRVFMKETEGLTRTEILEAYERLGMNAAADTLRGVEGMTASEAEFAKLYARWYDARKGLTAAQAAYIRKHPQEFFANV
jgi:hypothetical protein